MTFILRLLIGILPVLTFLLLLIFLDSYKLLKVRFILLTILWGFGIAIACLGINTLIIRKTGMEMAGYTRYVSPFMEETMKSLFIIGLMRMKRIGFLVDGAILGFALGAGFAIVENLYYLYELPDSTIFLWLIRGFGTAVMHGGVTATFSVISMGFLERGREERWRFVLPGLAAAVLLHSLFNHFLISPELSTIGLTVGVPLIMIVVFQQSERATRRWLGVGFDGDAELLDMITTGNIVQTRIGEYLTTLKERFSGEIVADMLCLLRIHLELSIRAKGMLLAREAGLDVPVDPAVKDKFNELRYLERSIGRTGRLAITPFLQRSSRELWQLHMLGGR